MIPALLVTVVSLVGAQAPPAREATITGVVRDAQSGEPLSDAIVALTDLDRAVRSDSLGRYIVRGVATGPQHMAVRRLGYAPRTLHALVPREGVLTIDIALRREPHVLVPVEVRPSIAMRGVEGDDVAWYPDRGVSRAGVQHHPLLAEPDALLAMGGGEIVMQPESPTGVHVRGGAADHTAYLLDGIPVFSPYHAAGTFSAWNPDALERIAAHTAAPPPMLGDALAGFVAATTRAPGSRLGVHGSASSAQARLTIDGPLDAAGAGFLLAIRSSFPGAIVQPDEPSYVHGGAGDLLAKLEMPLAGGRARLLAYASDDELNTAAEALAGGAPQRNEFEWRSRSLGAEWRRVAGGATVRALAWSADGGAEVAWFDRDGVLLPLDALRHDLGMLATVERAGESAATLGGIRIDARRTSYRVRSPTGVPGTALRGWTPSVTAFAGHRRPLGAALVADAALAATHGVGAVHLEPRVRLRWSPGSRLSMSASWDRAHQFAQSLRNAESIVGVVFPANLWVGAGVGGVPVARSDRAVVAAEVRPVAGLHLGAQAWARDFDDIVLVAPVTGEPFAMSGFTTGAGHSRGVSLEASASGARYGVLASWGHQRVRLRHAGGAWTPEHSVGQVLEAGVIVYPTATSSVRVGLTGVQGRRATPIEGGLEWEACNLLDWGCEFGGSPRHDTDALGATSLPSYVRLDLGVRKHWHLRIGGRDAMIAVFGTVTNLLDRGNAIAVVTDPGTGELTRLGMRPFAPLVIGLDWRF